MGKVTESKSKTVAKKNSALKKSLSDHSGNHSLFFVKERERMS